MTEFPLGGDSVADELLELAKLGKTAVLTPIPDLLPVEPNREDPTGPGQERRLPELVLEGRQELLRSPAGAEQPATLSAVLDLEPRPSLHDAQRNGDRGRAGLRS